MQTLDNKNQNETAANLNKTQMYNFNAHSNKLFSMPKTDPIAEYIKK